MNFQSRICCFSNKTSRITIIPEYSSILINYVSSRFVTTPAPKLNKTEVTQNIAKKFEKVSLQKFPLVRNDEFDIKKFSKINEIVTQCSDEFLDNKPTYFPSISMILNQTMPVESLAALKKWEVKKTK